MQYRRLGESDLQVSVVAMGCWAIGHARIWGEQDEQQATDAVAAALDAGINLFDTAPAYGRGISEQRLGKALGSRRDEAIIADKTGAAEPHEVIASCEESLQLLGTDCIDLYQVHWPRWEVPFADTMGAFEKLREQGKIRYIGVSNFTVEQHAEALSYGHVDSSQPMYSMLVRAAGDDVLPF